MIVDTLHLILRANLAGSLAIVAVAALRRPARWLVGASAAYGLWAIPVVMALAALPPSPADGRMTPIVVEAARGLTAPRALDGGSPWPAPIVGAWALGALLYAAMLATQQRRFAAALRGARPASIDGATVVRASGNDVGPAVVGRSIVLPADFETRFTPAEQAAVLAHERRHLARGDVVANAVVSTVQCLCWFNPLVHLAARWVRLDQELACDAAVIAERPALRRPYAEALLKTQVVAPVPPLGCAWRARGFAALRDRIRLLNRRAPSRARRAFGALALAGLSVGGGYAAWAAQPSRGHAVTAPDWSSMPSGADLARYYPPEAAAHETPGMAVLHCQVERTGALSACVVVRESPQGAGFGAAALQMAPLFQMKPMSRDGRPVAGGDVTIPIKFDLHPAPAAQP